MIDDLRRQLAAVTAGRDLDRLIADAAAIALAQFHRMDKSEVKAALLADARRTFQAFAGRGGWDPVAEEREACAALANIPGHAVAQAIYAAIRARGGA